MSAVVKKRLIIEADFNPDKTINNFSVSREMTDDEFVLLFATIYGRSLKFAELFTAVNKALHTIAAEKKVRDEYYNMLRNISIIDTDTGEVLEEIPAGVK